MTEEDEIEAILIDTYDEDEEAAAWEVAFMDGVKVPFPAELLGVPVTVLAFRSGPSRVIQGRVSRDKRERWIAVDDLDETGLPTDMSHLLNLYQLWGAGEA